MTVDELVHKLAHPVGDFREADFIRAIKKAVKSYDLTKLQHLNLSGTQVTDAGVRAVAEHCNQLQHLDLRGTRVTDAGVRAVAEHCNQLQHLDLWGLRQVTDPGALTVAKQCLQLQHLTLSGTRVTDAGVRAVAEHCHKLLYLDLRNCTQVTDAGVRAVAEHCNQLQHLDLTSTRATDAGVQAVVDRCHQLQNFILTSTEVTDTGVQTVAEGCPTLLRLSLWCCERVTDVGVQAVAKHCHKLLYLDLRGTQVKSVEQHVLQSHDAQQILAAIRHGLLLPVARIQFLGSGNVGKTCLFERCFLDHVIDTKRPRLRTPDIDLIRPEQCVWKPKLLMTEQTQEVEPRVWDFGGQMVLHGVHETFLGDDGRTVYVLVLSANTVPGSQYEGREEAGNAVAYWRKMIAHFGSDTAPVIAAVTQCDAVKGTTRPIDEPIPIGELVQDVTLVDDLSACDAKRPIEPLRSAMEAAIAGREGIRQGKVSPELKAVRDIVERELPKVALVPIATFRKWCRDCDVLKEQQADVIREILHHMGSLFYFGRERMKRTRDELDELVPGQQRLHKLLPDGVLNEYVINPVWLKHAAYRVFEESERGEWMSPETLRAKVQEADAKCSTHPHGGDVIEAFLKLVELSFFDEEKGHYLFPRGLKPGCPPGYEGWPKFALEWEFVPESAFHRFVVRMHHRRQVVKPERGGYAHGRDWVMLTHHECRVVVSANAVNGVIEIRFDPTSPPADRIRAFDFLCELLSGEFVGKEPTWGERPDQPQEAPEAKALRAEVESARDWVDLETATQRVLGPEGRPGTLKSYTQSKYGKVEDIGQFLRLGSECGRTREGYVWKRVQNNKGGSDLFFRESSLPRPYA